MRKIQTVTNGAKTVVVMFDDEDSREYCCELTENGKRNRRADYFTDYRPDALGTARAMVGLPPEVKAPRAKKAAHPLAVALCKSYERAYGPLPDHTPLEILHAYIADGVEYPDAEYKTVAQTGCDPEALRAAYDNNDAGML